MILSWIKARAEKRNTKIAANQPPSDFSSKLFSLMANGGRLKLMEAMFRLDFFSLFDSKITVPEEEIVAALGLEPERTQKWLHLLCDDNFLVKVKYHENKPAYELSDNLHALKNSPIWERTKFYFFLWNEAANENLTKVLQNGEVSKGYAGWKWPPVYEEQSVMLENWMADTSVATVSCILHQVNFNKVRKFIDIGGGDGTMACAFAKKFPHVQATVYNLPIPAELARKKIAAQNLSNKVSVQDGNFIVDTEFPKGFDLILFSRILFDWNEATSRKLLKMAYDALPPNGQVVICEFFKDDKSNQCLFAEYRYLFIDDFDARVMKTYNDYVSMLTDIGFTLMPTKKNSPDALHYSLILAKK